MRVLLSLTFIGLISMAHAGMFEMPYAGMDTSSEPEKVKTLKQKRYTPARSYPGMASFPPQLDFITLGASLKGEILYPVIEGYSEHAIMYNIRTTRFPYAIVMVENIEDIQKTMIFAKKHNLMVTIQSSGHSYIGRSTYDGSIQINLKKMKGRHVNLNSARNKAGEITVESGNRWLEVYREVDSIKTQENGTTVGRVIVGGSAHTVAMGGYTQGGGHSPISRTFGLAVDNLLEATIVTVDGSIRTVSEKGMTIKDVNGTMAESCDTSLYWAIRGGGGGTWGVVANFTFKLHYAPERVRNIVMTWVLKAGQEQQFGRDTVTFVMKELNKLCPQWGGYMLVGGAPVGEDTIYSGTLTLFLNHVGSDSDPCSNDTFNLYNYNVSGNLIIQLEHHYPTFLEYAETAKDAPSANTYVVNTFVQPGSVTTPVTLERLTDFIMSLEADAGCTGVMIGGATNDVLPGSTPVNPDFRSGLLSMTCYVSWEVNSLNATQAMDRAREMGEKLRKVGKGVYFNECDEDLSDWKELFWGSKQTYCKLAAIKRRLDPDNFLWCHNCVGSDFQFDCPQAVWWRQDTPQAYRDRMWGYQLSRMDYEVLRRMVDWD